MPEFFTELIDIVTPVLNFLSSLLDLVGVFIICLGAITILVHYVAGIVGLHAAMNIDQIRLHLGRNIVLAVEFLLAADIIRTIVTPDYYEIGMLGALVIIRTILTYFLNQELAQLQEGKL